MKIRTYLIAIVFSIFFLQIVLISAADAANKIMPLGDSITNGNASGVVPDATAYYVSYRKPLWDWLKAAGYVVNGDVFVGSLVSGNAVADFDPDHDGQRGWRADEILDGEDGIQDPNDKLSAWLDDYNPNIVLLHIGTNDVSAGNEDWFEIEQILRVIDDYETSPTGNAVWVILALIIDRSCDPLDPTCPPQSARTKAFNDDVFNNVWSPRQAGGVDKIALVDMENGAGIDYNRTTDTPPGDMEDKLHPFETGYAKMADLWFEGLMDILPQADAGPDQSVNEFDTVALDGSGSTINPKNGTLFFQWTQTAGTNVVLSDAQAEQPTFDAPGVPAAGETLAFMLTVTDADELVSTDTVDIDVQPVPPQAEAGDPQTVTEGATVTLDGTGSTGRSLTFAWTQTAGTGVTLTGAATAGPTFTAPDVAAAGGTLLLTFQLTVTDDLMVTSSDTVVVTVADFRAVAGDDLNAAVGQLVTLDGTASTGPIGSYAWIQTTGTLVQLSGADTATATFTAPNVAAVAAAVETLTFQLTVTDSSGQIESNDTTRVNIEDNTVPVTGGGGGGGGGCFIATASDGSAMASNADAQGELPNKFTIGRWKRLTSEHPGLLKLLTNPVGTPALAITITGFISMGAAIVRRKRWKRFLKRHLHERSIEVTRGADFAL